ncbi:MAG: MotA/TolQ/ExbB proton channel family protein [candidate division Zixibacteria bacterium]|nr:MotA/TolQ/ExbB proton channel family protein [candidate division Zixibacteria bacterium]MBU1470109.1 MotA/TolQ/ExbB proton channel family protein [candidate division Zixibacteria bacterium]MBU2626503.1 MotA/TolQ/ExbB proton channel family protein [candidate division Zixibacteria bacterium]
MTQTHDKPTGDQPAYRNREFLISSIVTVVVLVAAVFLIWQLRANSVEKINTMMDKSYRASSHGGIDSTHTAELGEIAKTDPVGFDLANYMQANYDKIVLVVYFLLAALTLSTLARFLTFLAMSIRRKKYYPDDVSLGFFLGHKPQTWQEFYDSVLNQDHRKSRFWRILKDSIKVTNASGRYDHLYLHFRNRIDRISEYLNETSLYESIASASPAAGFFGTLVGLLFIFSQSQGYMSSISQSPAFSIGMKVAIITSLWGLFNLGLSIVCSYFTKRVASQIHQQMVVRAVAVCEVVESLKSPVPEVVSRNQTVKEIEGVHQQ